LMIFKITKNVFREMTEFLIGMHVLNITSITIKILVYE
jgi:hypothetical protein